MDTVICLHSVSAFRALRELARRGVLLERFPHGSLLDVCSMPHCRDFTGVLGDELQELHLSEGPLHVLVGSAQHAHDLPGSIRHVCTRPLPPCSLMRIAPHVLCPVPELCFAQLAELSDVSALAGARLHTQQHAPFLHQIDLALLGFELCGTYFKDSSIEGGFFNTNRPLCTADDIASLLAELGRCRGAALARAAVQIVQDGSHSPGETSMSMLLSGPRRVGGERYPGGVLNYRVETAQGERIIDLAFPEYGLGLEYAGRAWHLSAEKDDRRRNNLAAAGMTILTVRHRDLADPRLFNELMRNIDALMGARTHTASATFVERQRLLRAKVLPPLERYSDIDPSRVG